MRPRALERKPSFHLPRKPSLRLRPASHGLGCRLPSGPQRRRSRKKRAMPDRSDETIRAVQRAARRLTKAQAALEDAVREAHDDGHSARAIAYAAKVTHPTVRA